MPSGGAPASGGPAQCRRTGTIRPEGRHRSVPMQHSGAFCAVNFCAALRQCAHVRFRRVSCMTLWRHVMATAAARRASDDDLRVCCASRVARPTDIRISRPHRAQRPNVHPPSCGAEFIRRFGGHRIGARRPRVDVKDRGMSRLPRCDSRVARARVAKNAHGMRVGFGSTRYARCLIERRCVRVSRRRSSYGPQARRPHFGRRPRIPPPQGCGPALQIG